MVDVAALIIFLVTYAIIAIQKIPRVHISRAAGALIGAVAMGLFGVLSPHEAYQAIDLDTIVFLLGMMIVVAHLEIAGFFEILELWILKRARSQRGLLALVIASSGLLSALFMNDTICLMFTPVLVRLVQRLHLDPVPYLLGLVLSANAGSMATLIGNPQNMLIGLRSGLSFVEFFIALGPAALLSLAAIYIIIVALFRGSLRGALPETPDLPEYHELSVQRGLLMVSLANLVLFLGLLIVGVSPQWAAISCAALILVLASNRPRRALQYVDWTLLLLFAGLFIVMRGLEATSWLDQSDRAGWAASGRAGAWGAVGPDSPDGPREQSRQQRAGGVIACADLGASGGGGRELALCRHGRDARGQSDYHWISGEPHRAGARIAARGAYQLLDVSEGGAAGDARDDRHQHGVAHSEALAAWSHPGDDRAEELRQIALAPLRDLKHFFVRQFIAANTGSHVRHHGDRQDF
jgi:Na+/H+ antiporter NhaD/arsenite permease-like protein